MLLVMVMLQMGHPLSLFFAEDRLRRNNPRSLKCLGSLVANFRCGLFGGGGRVINLGLLSFNSLYC